MDYYWKPKSKRKFELFKEKQKEVFLQQLQLARELNLPVIFHCRMAHQDLYEVLKLKIKNEKMKIEGVMHGFVGTTEQLKRYLEMGFYIGFNGIIFKNIEGINFKENIKEAPLDKILIETDCPYLTPPLVLLDYNLTTLPSREGSSLESLTIRNEPIYLKYIAEEIAKIKNLSFEEIAKITTENTKKLFKI